VPPCVLYGRSPRSAQRAARAVPGRYVAVQPHQSRHFALGAPAPSQREYACLPSHCWDRPPSTSFAALWPGSGRRAHTECRDETRGRGKMCK
jgi:hypothetical protein